jgi:uncharacterized membrane protein YdcZ (DUF606 family)
LVAVMVVTRAPAPSLARAAAAPWTAWLGGILGAGYAVVVVVLARHLGAATLTAAVVTGQLICSVVLDHFGLLGFELHGQRGPGGRLPFAPGRVRPHLEILTAPLRISPTVRP